MTMIIIITIITIIIENNNNMTTIRTIMKLATKKRSRTAIVTVRNGDRNSNSTIHSNSNRNRNSNNKSTSKFISNNDSNGMNKKIAIGIIMLASYRSRNSRQHN